jgi:hypothetical protein
LQALSNENERYLKNMNDNLEEDKHSSRQEHPILLIQRELLSFVEVHKVRYRVEKQLLKDALKPSDKSFIAIKFKDE